MAKYTEITRMLLRPELSTSGPPLAHRVRVNVRITFVALALLACSSLHAQTAAETLAQPGAQPASPPFVAARDTVLMKQVERDPGWFEQVTTIASGLMTISILVLTAALVPAAWNFRKNHQMIRKQLDKIQNDIAPIMRHASAIADDVNYITTSIRVDVQQVNQTVATVNRRLLEAVDKAEDRVNDFNALLEVAQEEAESAFISTASTLRGISSGASALAGPRGPRRARQRDRELRKRMAELRAAIDEDLQEAVEEVGPALDDSFGEEELTDGDNDGRSAADSGREAPRSGGQRPGDGSGA
ncbi:MAG TPA: DUF948 domain-containing protein [Gemmatimonadaceae bacterium]|nr:DUF948 domain-containing protein [Gemmatimonadaceae bacterium]